MVHSTCLPPRPCHTFTLRTVEKLRQQHLEKNGIHVQPKKISVFVEQVRCNLRRVEEALLYRLRRPVSEPQRGNECLLLSEFERVCVGRILADLVLDIATICITSNDETCDAVLSTNNTTFSTFSEGVMFPHSLKTDESLRGHDLRSLPRASEETHEPLEEAPLPSACGGGAGGSDGGSDMSLAALGRPARSVVGRPQSTSSISPIGERLHRPPNRVYSYNTFPSVDSHGESSNGKLTQTHSCFYDVLPPQHFSCGDAPLSPSSLHFKPVLSMHSGADSSTVCPPPRRRPRKYYDIDLQKLSDFTHYLRILQHLNLTDQEFETIGLRYAIPGIRELDPKEVQFLLERVNDRCHPLDDILTHSESADVPKCTFSLATTAGASEADARTVCLTYRESNPSLNLTPLTGNEMQFLEHELPPTTRMSLYQPYTRQGMQGGVMPGGQTHDLSPRLTPLREQCLPLFRGGGDIAVEKKDLHIFFAMVETCLKQVDHEVDGRLHAAGADLASNKEEEEVFFVT